MGQKTNPIGFRLGVIRTWDSKWFDEKNFDEKLAEDLMLRKYVHNRLQRASISRIIIERTPKQITLTIYTARPGIVIGRKGAEVDKLKEELQRITGQDIQLNINEIKRPELDAKLVADNIASQLAGKISFRRAMKKAIMSAMRMGAEGIRISCAGRLGGAEMARREQYKQGRIPLHTLRADIDYATANSYTTYGIIGVKVWICKGEVIGEMMEE
ncbi:30S ribosomal protein S3 [candidate division KSB1 bacterium]|nr:30S ribosomal protein S3 [candidate division KSB1 bacterium]